MRARSSITAISRARIVLASLTGGTFSRIAERSTLSRPPRSGNRGCERLAAPKLRPSALRRHSTNLTFPYVADCWFLTGPTAAGKSTVGIELARQLAGEIISLDSMAVYRHMDIGTAKPTSDQRRCPAPSDRHRRTERSVQPGAVHRRRRARDGRHSVARPHADLRGRNASLSEGSAAWHLPRTGGRLGISRAALGRSRAARRGLAARPSCAVDEAAAARLHPQDTKRLIRVLEVFEKTGQPITAAAKTVRPAAALRRVSGLRSRLATRGTLRADQRTSRRDVRRRSAGRSA